MTARAVYLTTYTVHLGGRSVEVAAASPQEAAQKAFVRDVTAALTNAIPVEVRHRVVVRPTAAFKATAYRTPPDFEAEYRIRLTVEVIRAK